MQNLVVGSTDLLGFARCRLLAERRETPRALVQSTSRRERVQALTDLGAGSSRRWARFGLA